MHNSNLFFRYSRLIRRNCIQKVTIQKKINSSLFNYIIFNRTLLKVLFLIKFATTQQFFYQFKNYVLLLATNKLAGF